FAAAINRAVARCINTRTEMLQALAPDAGRASDGGAIVVPAISRTASASVHLPSSRSRCRHQNKYQIAHVVAVRGQGWLTLRVGRGGRRLRLGGRKRLRPPDAVRLLRIGHLHQISSARITDLCPNISALFL